MEIINITKRQRFFFFYKRCIKNIKGSINKYLIILIYLKIPFKKLY